MNASQYKGSDASNRLSRNNRCRLPSLCPLHAFESICMSNDQIDLEMVHCSLWRSCRHWTHLPGYSLRQSEKIRLLTGLWVTVPEEHGWTRLGLHFPTTWISSLGLSPRHSRHHWSFINASHRPFGLSSLPLIGEMSSTNVNITWVRESGFLQGARKWMKTSEPIMFCYSTPFKWSFLPLWIRQRLGRLIERCRLCPCRSAVTETCLFVLFGRENTIVFDMMLYFPTQIIN